MQKRNNVIDAAKYVAALMVIAIHTGLFSDVNDVLYVFVVHIVCRAAVPFFAICTGYYMGGKLTFHDKLEYSTKNRDVFVYRWKKVVALYLIWTCMYLVFSIPFWIRSGWYSPMAFVDYAIAALINGSHYHLWYLLYLIYSLPIAYLLLRWCSEKHQVLLISVLWIIAAFTYTYKNFLPEPVFELLQPVNQFSTLPVLLPLLLLGVRISRGKRKRCRFYLIGFIVSFLLLIAEAFMLWHYGIESVSFIICTLPTAYFLFNLILEMRIPSQYKFAGILGAVSTFVYCVHPMFIETVGNRINNSILKFVTASIASTATGWIYYSLKTRLIEKKDHSCFN